MWVRVCVVALALWLLGIIYSMLMQPSSQPVAPHSIQAVHTNTNASLPFWTPIDVNFAHFGSRSTDPTIVLCQLDFRTYSASPHASPMFRDLVRRSNCGGARLRSAKLSELKSDPILQDYVNKGYAIKPSGFVFHESRVGSTLVANALACDPLNMVFSESTPIAKVLLQSSFLTREAIIALLQDIVLLMGVSTTHKRMYFKFQSSLVKHIGILLEAFPTTSWVFLFRQPVQVMVSNLANKFASSLNRGMQARGGPCLRTRGNKLSKSIVLAARESRNESVHQVIADEEWCAAHLHLICINAINAYRTYGVLNSGHVRRGVVLDYSSLPGSAISIVFPLFKQPINSELLVKIVAELSFYSKSRAAGGGVGGGVGVQPMKMYANGVFKQDSEDKNSRASTAMTKYSLSILMPSFKTLAQASEESISSYLTASALDLIPPLGLIPGKNWTAISQIDLDKYKM